ncbi:MAG: hypothetical protein GF308_05015 [Candidatus Heimdallarchaeota archaeon]|nr:hypothetical protein [Candidatus Heimdallarchaeota archaeon]
MAEESPPLDIDGKSEIIIKHKIQQRWIEFAIFFFWLSVGILAIIFGALAITQSIFFRIALMVIGIFTIVLFFEGFLSKMRNQIVLNLEGIKTRLYFKWEFIPWEKVSSIEVEKRIRKKFRSTNNTIKPIGLEIHTQEENKSIIYPLRSFSDKEAEKVVAIIKEYFRLNCKDGEIFEKTFNSNEQERKLEEELDASIPPRVEEFEIEEE